MAAVPTRSLAVFPPMIATAAHCPPVHPTKKNSIKWTLLFLGMHNVNTPPRRRRDHHILAPPTPPQRPPQPPLVASLSRPYHHRHQVSGSFPLPAPPIMTPKRLSLFPSPPSSSSVPFASVQPFPHPPHVRPRRFTHHAAHVSSRPASAAAVDADTIWPPRLTVRPSPPLAADTLPPPSLETTVAAAATVPPLRLTAATTIRSCTYPHSPAADTSLPSPLIIYSHRRHRPPPPPGRYNGASHPPRPAAAAATVLPTTPK